MNCIYSSIPMINNEFKLLLIFWLNNKENKSFLGTIVLIKNENVNIFMYSKLFKI